MPRPPASPSDPTVGDRIAYIFYSDVPSVGLAWFNADGDIGQEEVSLRSVADSGRCCGTVIGSGAAQGATVTVPFVKAPWGDTFGMVTDRFGVHCDVQCHRGCGGLIQSYPLGPLAQLAELRTSKIGALGRKRSG